MSEEHEELEQIPWSVLAASSPDPRWRLAAAAVGVVLFCAVLILVAMRFLGAGSAVTADRQPAAAPSVASAPGTSAVPVVPRGTAPTTVAASPSPEAYSEADLRAVSVDEEVLLAAMWAESFTRDYLTVDGDDALVGEIAALLGVDLPPPAAGVVSYVEWVRAFSVMAADPARYQVDVAYRLLVGKDGQFERQPAGAIGLELLVDVGGSVRLTRLPEAIGLPETIAAPPPDLVSDLPEGVRAGVGGAEILGGYQLDDLWHVVVLTERAPGIVRPSLVSVEG